MTLRLRASAATPRPKLAKVAKRARIASEAAVGRRKIYWADLKRTAATPIFDGALLVPGNRLAGPAVVETTDTTVVVHPGRKLADHRCRIGDVCRPGDRRLIGSSGAAAPPLIVEHKVASAASGAEGKHLGQEVIVMRSRTTVQHEQAR